MERAYLLCKVESMVKLFPSENTRRWQRGEHEVLSLVKIQCSLKQPLWSAEGKVDKKREKCAAFVYRLVEIQGARI